MKTLHISVNRDSVPEKPTIVPRSKMVDEPGVYEYVGEVPGYPVKEVIVFPSRHLIIVSHDNTIEILNPSGEAFFQLGNEGDKWRLRDTPLTLTFGNQDT